MAHAPLPAFEFVDKVSDKAGKVPVIVAVPVARPAKDGDAAVAGPLAETLAALDLTALGASESAGSVRVTATGAAPATVALVGGICPEASADEFRDAAANVAREVDGTGARLVLALGIETAEQASAAALGALLGAYRFDRYRTDTRPAIDSIAVLVPARLLKSASAASQRVRILATNTWRARDLVNTAPNDLTPAEFAAYAIKAAKLPRVKTTSLDLEALKAGGFGGHVAVGQGSINPPHLVKVAYKPSKAKGHVALVGKGITFDSGGLSIKPAKSMETMKSDMAGAATVLATVIAAAELSLPIAVTGWLCLAENMPSGSATRPSDVITIHGGTTVEVLNTDAEGRLVLADGLSAAREEKPDVLLDIATLTGAQLVALGPEIGAVMGSEDVRSEVIAAGDAAGEDLWPMPLPAHLRPSLKSPVADIANMGDRFGGMLVAGLFLKEFVGSTPWAHLDVAGPAYNERAPHGIAPTGGTGFGLSTLLTFLETRAS
nr:leucyl aminopeptidase [Rarobacter faecitabidus]